MEKKRFADEGLVRKIIQLDPLIQRSVQTDGRKRALNLLKVLKNRTPRVTLIELVAKAQLRHEGPNADLDWVLPRKKDVPLAPLYMSVAEEQLRAREQHFNLIYYWNLVVINGVF